MRRVLPLIAVGLLACQPPAAAPDSGPGRAVAVDAAPARAAALDAAPAVALDARIQGDVHIESRATVSGTTAAKRAALKQLGEATSRLDPLLRTGASDAGSAWALAHGLVGFGPALKASNGKLAIDAMVEDFVEPGSNPPRFPAQSKGGLPVEPHPRLIVKSLLEAGVPLAHAFTLPGGRRITLGQLAHAQLDGVAAPKTEAEWRQFAWTLSATWTLAGIEHGKGLPPAVKTRLSGLLEAALVQLESEQDFLRQAMVAGRPDSVEKKKQKIFGHPCGGLHLLQTVLQGASLVGTPQQRARALLQLDVLAFRWTAERRIYREMRAKNPSYDLILRVQELKFHGHVLETYGLAVRWGILKSTPAVQALVEGVVTDLADAVSALEPSYERQSQLRAKSLQTYLDLIGDGCHALRGLRLALVSWFAD